MLEEVYNSSSNEDSNKYVKEPELRPGNHSAANFSANLEDGDADEADALVSGIVSREEPYDYRIAIKYVFRED